MYSVVNLNRKFIEVVLRELNEEYIFASEVPFKRRGFLGRVGLSYTCQLFLRYKREIFILGVLGFLKTTPSFPKSAEDEVIEKTLIHKIRDPEEGIVIYSFYTCFSFLTWV